MPSPDYTALLSTGLGLLSHAQRKREHQDRQDHLAEMLGLRREEFGTMTDYRNRLFGLQRDQFASDREFKGLSLDKRVDIDRRRQEAANLRARHPYLSPTGLSQQFGLPAEHIRDPHATGDPSLSELLHAFTALGEQAQYSPQARALAPFLAERLMDRLGVPSAQRGQPAAVAPQAMGPSPPPTPESPAPPPSPYAADPRALVPFFAANRAASEQSIRDAIVRGLTLGPAQAPMTAAMPAGPPTVDLTAPPNFGVPVPTQRDLLIQGARRAARQRPQNYLVPFALR